MQESTLRRSDCSGVMTLAGAPSWVRGRGFCLKMFRRMMRLLSEKPAAGEKSDTDRVMRATPEYSLEAGIEPAPPLARRSAVDEPVPCATGRLLVAVD
jgi:tRNA U38,U39,U40 pseudouridine synthase TruA